MVSSLQLFVKIYESKENFMQYSQIDSSDIMYQYTAVEINQLLILFAWERPQMNTRFPSKLCDQSNQSNLCDYQKGLEFLYYIPNFLILLRYIYFSINDIWRYSYYKNFFTWGVSGHQIRWANMSWHDMPYSWMDRYLTHIPDVQSYPLFCHVMTTSCESTGSTIN